MGVYVRVFPDFCVEIVLTERRFKRRKRIHILINPNSNVELDLFAPEEQEAVINPEGLTHLLYLERPSPSLDIFEKTLNLHEMLNKPVITEEQTAQEFRKRGVSIRQLRIISREGDTLDGLKIHPIYYSFKDYDPDSESVSLVDEEPTNIFQKILSFGDSITSVFRKIPLPTPFLKEKIEDIAEKPNLENPMAVLLEFSKLSILVPIDPLGCDHIERILQIYQPTLLLLPESTLGVAAQINAKLKKVVTFDKQYPKDKVALIPRSHNDFADFDTLVASLEEWVEVSI